MSYICFDLGSNILKLYNLKPKEFYKNVKAVAATSRSAWREWLANHL